MMIQADDIKRLMKEGEGFQLEMKACGTALPSSVWETYSAFANSRGGIILLGVTEHKTRSASERFEVTGVSDANKIVTDFFNLLNNPQKVSCNVLVDSDVRIVEVDGKDVVYINVPEANYRNKPIYINNNLQSGSYKRLFEGDCHLNKQELTILIRDSSDDIDSQIIECYGMQDIDQETLKTYRLSFQHKNPHHAYEALDDKEFLMKMGGYAEDRKKSLEGLTMAGLLMFGKGQSIHEVFPSFRVDYLDRIDIQPGDDLKWNDRLTDDGRWEDNLYNFLILTLRKLLFTLPSEGRIVDGSRKDGGVLYDAIREAMVNSLTYCDYKLGGVLRIDRMTDKIVMRNPGTLRIAPERIYEGDYTRARNATIQKMLRMVGFGDNIGSGFQKIMKAWESLRYVTPDIHEEPEVTEVWLTLPLYKNIVKPKKTIRYPEVNEEITMVKEPEGLYARRKNDSAFHLTPIQERILDEIKADPYISIPEIADKIGVKEGFVRSQRRSMEKFVELRRIGSRKTGFWQIIPKK
ncbi:MAG: putative DNA binding domain-containing protein [Muribaculaceae bacterium]|nr:putative DNA binding domain-containing protein [Muribaculaceae bacterium]